MPFSSVLGAQSVVRPGVCTSSTRPAAPYDGQVVYLTDTDQTLVWNGATWSVLAPIAGGRNVLINGALDIWQRGTSFTASGVYSADRMIVGRSGGATGATFTRVSPNDSTNLPNFRYAMRCQRNSGNTGTAGLTFGQVIETSNSIPLAGKTVTLSFYARAGANFTGTFLYSYVFTGTGTDQNGILGAWTGLANPVQGTHTLTTTWARYTATGTLSSSTNEIFFNFANSPVGTAGADDWYEVTGIQLEEGAVATPFEFEDYGTTLQKCLRYFHRRGDAVTGGQMIGTHGYQSSATVLWRLGYDFAVKMRAIPTVTFFNMMVWDGSATTSTFAFTSNLSTQHGMDGDFSSGALTAGRYTKMYLLDSTSYIQFSAEL